MKKPWLIIALTCVMCTGMSYEDPWVCGVLEADNVLGTWSAHVTRDAGHGDGSVITDTVLWTLTKTGPRRNDSLFYIREYHTYGKAFDPLRDAHTSGKVGYLDGDGTDELDYGSLKFRMPTEDSLWIQFGVIGSWERLKRR